MNTSLLSILLSSVLLITGCSSIGPQKLKWHSMRIAPKVHDQPIRWYKKFNLIWWFGNVDEPKAPAWYRPNRPLRNTMWYIRNPFDNFSNYIIGVADKKTVRSGWYPTENGNPRNGWNFAVTRRRIIWLPFVDYKKNHFEFYFGWRMCGNFGVKLNFHQKSPK